MIPVKGHPNLYRDENTGAIVNYDTNSYNQYVTMQNSRNLQIYEIEKMKKDIDEIKCLLREFLNGTK